MWGPKSVNLKYKYKESGTDYLEQLKEYNNQGHERIFFTSNVL